MTFYLISKLLPPFLLPPGQTLVLLALAAVLRKRRPRLAAVLVLLAFGALWALSTQAVSNRLGAALEARYLPVPLDRVPQADAAIVLGGLIRIPSSVRPAPELNESSDRLWVAAQLYRAGKAPLILISGGNAAIFGERAMPESRAAAMVLTQWGVPEGAILEEGRSQNTRENVAFSKSMLEARGAKRILLVTSAFHMPRAVAIFRRAGLDPFPVPTDYQTGWDDKPLPLTWVPEPENLTLSKVMLREWIGLWVYRLRGWA